MGRIQRPNNSIQKYTKQSIILQSFYLFIFKYFLAANKEAKPPIKIPAKKIDDPT